MTYTFTRNELLMKKLYNELDPTENQAVEEAFLLNPTVKEEFDMLVEAKKLLDQGKVYQPSQNAIDNILLISQITKSENSFC